MSAEYGMRPPIEQQPLAEAPFHTWTLPDDSVWTEFYRLDAAYLLRFPGLADFRVQPQSLEVDCFPTPGVSAQTVEHLYLNQVLPLVFSQQGRLVFHASAVEIDGAAVAFVGETGRGKSTLAAAFAREGRAFLTDDGLVLDGEADDFVVLPGHASIRLWEDAESFLLGSAVAGGPVAQYTSKARFFANDELQHCRRPRALRRVYFLGGEQTSDVRFVALSAADALMEWVKHSFLLDIREQPVLARHFDRLSGLANRPLHFRLDYPRDFSRLGEVRSAIISHVKGGRENHEAV